MPYLFDEFGQRKEVSESTFYLSGLVDRLFDDMLEILGGRIEVRDFRKTWYQLVPFILFVIRLAHVRAQLEIDPDIQSYLSDQNNPDSYLNRFNNPEYKSLEQYDPAWLAETVGNAYKSYWELYEQSSKNLTNLPFVTNELLGKLLAGPDREQVNLQDAFSFLERKFASGEIKLFES